MCRNKHQRCKYSNVVKHLQAIIIYLIIKHTSNRWIYRLFGQVQYISPRCLSFFFLFFLHSHNYLQECGNTFSAFTFQSRACGWIQCFTLIKHPLCSLMSVYMCPPLSSFSAHLDWLIHWTHPVPIRPRGFGSDSIWVVCLLTRQLPS